MSQWKGWHDIVAFLDTEIAAERKWIALAERRTGMWSRFVARAIAPRADEARRRLEYFQVLRHNAFSTARMLEGYDPPKEETK